MTRILITRAQPHAGATAKRLNDLGYQPICAPASLVTPIPHSIEPQNYGGVILTSQNAAIHAKETLSQLTHLPIFCVGDKTAQAAHQAGCTDIYSANGNAADLQALITRSYTGARPLLYLSGRNISAPIHDHLSAQGLPVTRIIAYQADTAPSLPLQAISAIEAGQIDTALFFSKRGAEQFLSLSKAHNLQGHFAQIKALSISHGVVEYMDNWGWKASLASQDPTLDSMIQTLQDMAPTSAT